MNDQINLDLISKLFAQIERAWLDHHDRKLVYQLSREHPELRSQLYEFFEDLVLGAEREPASDISEAETRAYEWLQSSGLDLAATAAEHEQFSRRTTTETPTLGFNRSEDPGNDLVRNETKRNDANQGTTWLDFLRRRTNLRLSDLAGALQNVTIEYFVMVSRHPNLVPEQAKMELAKVTEDRWGVPAHDSLQCLTTEHSVRRAASRTRPFEKEPATFEDILERSALTPQQRAFWLQYAKRKD
jgi:hypothetical protein